MFKKSLLLLFLLLPVGIISSCSDEESNSENKEIIFKDKDQLNDAISSDIVDYVEQGTTAAFEDMVSFWNYPYITYSYIHAWFSDRDLLSEQLSEKLIEQVNMSGIDNIIQSNVEKYNATNKEKLTIKNKLSQEKEAAWEKEMQQMIQNNETISKVKQQYILDLQDNGLNILIVLIVLIPLSMIVDSISKSISGYNELQETIERRLRKKREGKGFWHQFGSSIVEGVISASIESQIDELNEKRMAINIFIVIVDIATLVGSILYFGSKSEENFTEFANTIMQNITQMISNYDLSTLFI